MNFSDIDSGDDHEPPRPRQNDRYNDEPVSVAPSFQPQDAAFDFSKYMTNEKMLRPQSKQVVDRMRITSNSRFQFSRNGELMKNGESIDAPSHINP